jgi:glycosyltransferase involved in cell wall biosynthesis
VKISIVIPTRNEDPADLRMTVDSFREAGADEVIVIDDCSDTAASVDGAKIIRNDEAQGPAYCRNLGVSLASHDIVVLSDSHVRIKDGELTAFAELARKTNGFVCAKAKALDGDGDWTAHGGNLQAQESGYRCAYKLSPVNAPTSLLGSVYGFTKQVYHDIGGLPPTLSWGYNEQAMSMALLFAGKDIVIGDMVIEHRFKEQFNYPVHGSYTHGNRVLVHWMLFSQEEFERVWEPMFREKLADGWDVASQVLEHYAADRERFQAHKQITDQQFYERVAPMPSLELRVGHTPPAAAFVVQ